MSAGAVFKKEVIRTWPPMFVVHDAMWTDEELEKLKAEWRPGGIINMRHDDVIFVPAVTIIDATGWAEAAFD